VNRKLLNLAITAALAAGSAAVHAQQQFGRDSVYAVPGSSAAVNTRGDLQRFGRDSVYATDAAMPSSPAVARSVDKAGRDSVYARQTQTDPSTPVATNATGLQQNGRDSVYAIQFQGPSSPETGTKVYGSGTGARHGG